MKCLVLCFDGTWNTIINPSALTNIVELANTVSVLEADGRQPRYPTIIQGSAAAGRSTAFLGGCSGGVSKAMSSAAWRFSR